MTKFAILLLIVIQTVLSSPIFDNLVVELPDGLVQGTTYLTGNNKTYFGFQGIPYAAPPIGNLRFEAPQPPKPWDHIWDATKDGNICIATNYWNHVDTQSEDCLNLNVYTPDIKPASKLPVMFWIYGGTFRSGSSMKALYGPDFLMERDVIVVSFNYRLGAFGFLSTGDEAIRGNAGLKDQSFALKWTHDNIAYFGGDPDKITIFGESAGGASVGLHLLNKKSEGLFRAAIVESGSALTFWTIDQNPTTFSFPFADELSGGIYKNDTQKLKEFLQAKSIGEIVNATTTLRHRGRQGWPVVEVEGEDAFLSESPYELIESGQFNQVPILTGICAQESLMFIDDLEQAEEYAIGLDLIPSFLIPWNLRENSSDKYEIIKAIRNIYLAEGETFLSNLIALADFLTDDGFSRGVIKQAELSSKYVPVYLYQFAYYGRPISEVFIDGIEKAGHGAEVPFIFNGTGISNTTDPADLLTQDRMTYLWTNFAKFLNPTPEPSELFNNVIWPTISPNDLKFLNINETLEVRSNFRNNSYPAWNEIYETYGKKPFVTY